MFPACAGLANRSCLYRGLDQQPCQSMVFMLADHEHQAQLRDLQPLRQPAAGSQLQAGKFKMENISPGAAHHDHGIASPIQWIG